MNPTEAQLDGLDDPNNGTRRTRRGLLLAPDDLEKGLLVTVHHWRDGGEFGVGHAARVKAVQLPFVVIHPLPEARYRPVTLDLRDTVLMKVSEEFALAQVGTDQTDLPPPNSDTSTTALSGRTDQP